MQESLGHDTLWANASEAPPTAFSEDQVADMHEFLKERGLFAFLSEYLDRKQVAPNALLLAFGVRVVSPVQGRVRLRIGLYWN